MSDSFLVAARLPMGRDAFERWLDAPVPGREAIANIDEMFAGWFWDGKAAGKGWSKAGRGLTVREWLAERVEGSCGKRPTLTIVRHEDEALQVYLFDVGYSEWDTQPALLALAAAAPSAPGEVLFWAETGGQLLDPAAKGWLAVLEVGPDGARFVRDRDLTAAVAGLRGIEDVFFAAAERVGEAEEEWDPQEEPEFRTQAPKEFVDPAVLR
ncbi:hypothetical protein [Dactylosporangium sp. CA-233914]|uniref:hypothetical protein n=1 Tax=Dactylosporangium sp. CA-233914 TaxID=3239934 RepID=UPI003D8C6243